MAYRLPKVKGLQASLDCIGAILVDRVIGINCLNMACLLK